MQLLFIHNQAQTYNKKYNTLAYDKKALHPTNTIHKTQLTFSAWRL